MDCKYCSKSFFKGEHLVRHERSHTGVRPFVCAHCSRPFARQDSLARHQKLHRRRDTGVVPKSPPNKTIRQSLPSPLSSIGDDIVNQTPTQPVLHATTWEEERDNSTSQNQNEQISAFLDFDLIWPDSEQLFESLMALDTTTARLSEPVPLTSAPLSEIPRNIPTSSIFSPPTTSLMGPNTAGESHRAVNNVSEMVTALSSHVTSAVEATSVTSVFLDECLHMFFERFIPTFPILHRATFVFRDYSQPLLLNAMAIGSLYLGPKSAIAKGEALWRLAHVAVTTSWEKLITHRGVHDTCSGVQLVITALLSQAYGALSKNRAIRTTSQAFHALGFYWARQCAISATKSCSRTSLPSPDSPEEELRRCWQVWAAKEVQHRALLGHYLLDGLLSRTTGEPSSVRHSANSLGLPSREDVFNARTTTDWLSLVTLQKHEQYSFRGIINSLFQPVGSMYTTILSGPAVSAFSLRVVLEGLQSFVSDCDNDDIPMMGVPTKVELRRALVQVYGSICKNQSLTVAERLETLLRWHTICLDTCKDSSTLCLSICARYNITQHICGSQQLSRNELDLVSWVNSEDARRALLHAISIQDIVEQLPRGRAHVIHIPSSLFAAATVYCVFSLGGHTSVDIPKVVDWEDVLSTHDDLALSTRPSSLAGSETINYIRGDQRNTLRSIGTNKNLLYELNSMQKLFRCLCSQWGIAYDMEDVIDQWNTLCH